MNAVWSIIAMLAAMLVAQAPQGSAPVQLPAPQAAAVAQDSDVDSILDDLDARGQNLTSFQAEVVLTEIDQELMDQTIRTGTAVYQKRGQGDARMRVIFDKRQAGNRIRDQKVEYLLDDRWLTERDYDRKVEIRRQVLRPGQQMDLLKLGEGPFPLPIGQPKEEVCRLFEVTRHPIGPGEPAGTAHLTLTPRPGSQFERRFSAIDVWVDPQTSMPVRIETQDRTANVLRRTDLTLRGINEPIPSNAFDLPAVGNDWNRHEEPYRD